MVDGVRFESIREEKLPRGRVGIGMLSPYLPPYLPTRAGSFALYYAVAPMRSGKGLYKSPRPPRRKRLRRQMGNESWA
jgi:hypothetical protein